MGLLGPKGGAQGSPPKGLYKQRKRAPKNPSHFYYSRYCLCEQCRRREQYLRRATVPPLLCAQALGRLRGPSSPDRDASSCTCGYLGGAAFAAQRTSRTRGGSRNCTAGFHLHYTDALQKFHNRASSGNPVIYNCSNPGLCGRKFLFLLPQIPTAVSRASAVSL